jgi:putative transposase
MQNGLCESFNGPMRDELLNDSLFLGLGHARTKLTNWVDDYNQRRPHSALGYLTPVAYGRSPHARPDGGGDYADPQISSIMPGF